MPQGSLMTYDMFPPQGFVVCEIPSKDTYDLLLNTHYAKRIPSISYAYGLFDSGELIGVVTYGKPPAATQRKGVCGDELSGYVLELNRLCLVNNKRNEASQLVSSSLKMLPKPSVILSYADPEQGHVGYIYQATNFLYCGLTAKRSNWMVKGMEHLHSQTIADKYRGVKNPAKAIREEHGDNFYLKDRPRKHRYIYIVGSKTQRKMLKKALRYKQEEYPKLRHKKAQNEDWA
jgi:hypothetical protein